MNDPEVLTVLLAFCDKRVSIWYGFNSPVNNNGLQFPPLCDLIAVMKMRRKSMEDGKKQVPTPSNMYFHIMYENLCAFPLKCVQHRMVTFRVENIKLH